MGKRLIGSFIRITNNTNIGQYLYKQVVRAAMELTISIQHNQLDLTFAVPNTLNLWRIKTFSTKEPETLEWIDNIPTGSILWDIGANIGLYSIYSAKKSNCQVWAFEPSVFNLELLARNIFLNDMTEQICIVPVALSDKLGVNQLHMTTTEWGGALSTFGEDYGWDGNKIQQVFEYKTLGLSMEDIIRRMSIPQPDYIKMDVDGLEHMILMGGSDVLKGIKGILIEVNDDFDEQADQCRILLAQAGLVLDEKRHSEIMSNSTAGFENTYNQIWIRP